MKYSKRVAKLAARQIDHQKFIDGYRGKTAPKQKPGSFNK